MRTITLVIFMLLTFSLVIVFVDNDILFEESVISVYVIYLPIIQREGAYYVSPDGDDSNPGTISRPWKTINKAASMVQPGDIVYIRDGIYYESIHFETSGSPSLPIKILAYPGESPIIDGNNTIPGPGSALIWIVGDYLITSGLEVRNSAYVGILVIGNNAIVENMDVHHNQDSGILVYEGHNSLIENCRIWRNSLYNEYGQGSNWSSGLSVYGDNATNNTLRHNVVWENWGEGISTGADHTIIENNITHDNYSIDIYISDATNIICQRNFIYSDPTSYINPYGYNIGISMGDESYDPPSANIILINNVAYSNYVNLWWWQGVQGGGMNNVLIANNTFVNATVVPGLGRGNITISAGDHINVRFENNLVRQDNTLPVIATIDQPGVFYSYNLWSKPPYPAASGPGDIIADPLLAEFGSPFLPDWFRLLATSPAINHALSLPEVLVDYFGNWRDSSPDMGAVEYFP